eukprot:2561538-Prymnesium_polylepis.1
MCTRPQSSRRLGETRTSRFGFRAPGVARCGYAAVRRRQSHCRPFSLRPARPEVALAAGVIAEWAAPPRPSIVVEPAVGCALCERNDRCILQGAPTPRGWHAADAVRAPATAKQRRRLGARVARAA